MLVFLNGHYVPEAQALVPVFDRGFLYGDGLFETLPIFDFKPVGWNRHWRRLEAGAERLALTIPFPRELLRDAAVELARRNRSPNAILRLTLTRGAGRRGYSPRGAGAPCLVMFLHPGTALEALRPPEWRLITSSVRLPVELAWIKSCNKLPQVLARAEAEAAGADEAVFLGSQGEVLEGASSNVFWVDGGTVCTPPISCGILGGITREIVLELCQALGIPTRQTGLNAAALHQQQGVFLTLSSAGIAMAVSLDGKPIARSEVVDRLWNAYRSRVAAGVD